MSKILFIFIIAFTFSNDLKAEERSKDCNAYACASHFSDNGRPAMRLKSKSTEELVCFVYTDQRKKVFKLSGLEPSPDFVSQYEQNYHYFSWNCGKTSSCPSWGKRYC